MAFLRKWGGSTGGNPAVNPSSANGVGGAGGNGTGGKDGTPAEWYSDTPGERYFGMENVSTLSSLLISLPSVLRDVVSSRSSVEEDRPLVAPY